VIVVVKLVKVVASWQKNKNLHLLL
jgi:hypothetical protein